MLCAAFDCYYLKQTRARPEPERHLCHLSVRPFVRSGTVLQRRGPLGAVLCSTAGLAERGTFDHILTATSTNGRKALRTRSGFHGIDEDRHM
jgi:hypothetical protein